MDIDCFDTYAALWLLVTLGLSMSLILLKHYFIGWFLLGLFVSSAYHFIRDTVSFNYVVEETTKTYKKKKK